MTYINTKTGKSFNFVAPATPANPSASVDGDKIEVQFPVFDTVAPELASNECNVTVEQTETLVDLGSTALAAKATINADVNAPAGSKLYVKFVCGGTKYDVDVKAGGVTTTITGVASKTNGAALVFDGTSYILI